jgi:hypothetical protein
MLSPSSRSQITAGCGDPVAAQRSITFVPSRTTMSVLVESFKISGGTANAEKKKHMTKIKEIH